MTASLDNVVPPWESVEDVARSVQASPLMMDAPGDLTPIEGVRDFARRLVERLLALGVDAAWPPNRSVRSTARVPEDLEKRVYGAFLRETDPDLRVFALQLVEPEMLGRYAGRWERGRLDHAPSLAGRTGVLPAPDPVAKGALEDLRSTADELGWELWTAAAEVARHSVRHRMRETTQEVLGLIENSEGLDAGTRIQRLADTVRELKEHAAEACDGVATLQYWRESDPADSWQPEIASPAEALRRARELLDRYCRPLPLTIEAVARATEAALLLMRDGGIYGVPGVAPSIVSGFRWWPAGLAAPDAQTLLDRVDALRDTELRGTLLGLVDPDRDLPPDVARRWTIQRSLAKQPPPYSPQWIAGENAEHQQERASRPDTNRADVVRDTPADVDAASVRADVVDLVRDRLDFALRWIAHSPKHLPVQDFADAVASLRDEAVEARNGVDRATIGLHPASAHRIASAAIGGAGANLRSAGERSEGRTVTPGGPSVAKRHTRTSG